MTQKQALAWIRSLGLTVSYNPEYREYRIDYKTTDTRKTDDSAYFANDAQDAVYTAQAMARWSVRHG